MELFNVGVRRAKPEFYQLGVVRGPGGTKVPCLVCGGFGVDRLRMVGRDYFNRIYVRGGKVIVSKNSFVQRIMHVCIANGCLANVVKSGLEEIHSVKKIRSNNLSLRKESCRFCGKTGLKSGVVVGCGDEIVFIRKRIIVCGDCLFMRISEERMRLDDGAPPDSVREMTDEERYGADYAEIQPFEDKG